MSPDNASASGLVPAATNEKSGVRERPRRQVSWPEVAHEVAEYFAYEPRVPEMNNEGGSRPPPFGRHLQFPQGATYHFMMTVYDRLKVADRYMPYLCNRKIEQPSASMTLRAAYGSNAAKYDDSAPKGEKFLQLAQAAYSRAASEVGRRTRESEKDKILRRFDLIFSGVMGKEKWHGDPED